jgi:hypothetical protein
MIAISYRREDSLPIAGRLYDRLQAKFGKENVFMDFDSIPPGVDFREQIKQTIERSNVVIAVIGPHWLGEQSDGSRRIDDPTDFVRLEIEYALKGGIPVIPLLINNTPMPKPEKLPPDIESLAFRNALPLDSGLDFHQHTDRLINGISNIIETTAPTVRRAPVRDFTGVERHGVRPKQSIKYLALALLLVAGVAVLAWFGFSNWRAKKFVGPAPSNLVPTTAPTVREPTSSPAESHSAMAMQSASPFQDPVSSPRAVPDVKSTESFVGTWEGTIHVIHYPYKTNLPDFGLKATDPKGLPARLSVNNAETTVTLTCLSDSRIINLSNWKHAGPTGLRSSYQGEHSMFFREDRKSATFHMENTEVSLDGVFHKQKLFAGTWRGELPSHKYGIIPAQLSINEAETVVIFTYNPDEKAGWSHGRVDYTIPGCTHRDSRTLTANYSIESGQNVDTGEKDYWQGAITIRLSEDGNTATLTLEGKDPIADGQGIFHREKSTADASPAPPEPSGNSVPSKKIAGSVESGARKTSSPTVATTSSTTLKSQRAFGAAGHYPYGIHPPGKPNMLESPFSPGTYVNVKGLAPGTKVKDPRTGKVFLVP